MENKTGRCLCGSVVFRVERAQGEHHACHCSMCRRWTGAPMMAIQSQGVTFESDATLKRYDSSDFAQRGFCTECGTSLFYFFKAAEMYFIARGAFDDQSGFKLVGEIYVDNQPPGYAFAGDLERLTEAEFLAQFGSG